MQRKTVTKTSRIRERKKQFSGRGERGANESEFECEVSCKCVLHTLISVCCKCRGTTSRLLRFERCLAWAKCEALPPPRAPCTLAAWHLHTLQRVAVNLPHCLLHKLWQLMLRCLHAHNHRLPPLIGVASVRSSRHRLHMWQHGRGTGSPCECFQ